MFILPRRPIAARRCGQVTGNVSPIAEVNPHALLTAKLPLQLYVPRATVIALLGSMLVGGAAFAVAHFLGLLASVRLPPDRQPTLTEFVGLAVVGPVLETALLAVTIRVLRTLTKSARLVSALAAILWGSLHGLVALLWFFGTVWSFYVYATGYQAFSKRSSGQAFLAACLPHSLVNTTVFVAFLLERNTSA